MASSNSQDVVTEPPRKRQRLSPPPSTSTSATTTPEAGSKVVKMDDTIKQSVMSDTGFQPEREVQVGILHFVNSENPGFTGTLKQRYVLRVSCSIAFPFELISRSIACKYFVCSFLCTGLGSCLIQEVTLAAFAQDGSLLENGSYMSYFQKLHLNIRYLSLCFGYWLT
jgi:hypothetical protein